MQHYKAPDNSLHFIEPEFAHLLPAGSIPIPDEEAEALRPQPDTSALRAAKLAEVRTKRKGILDILAGIALAAQLEGDTATTAAFLVVRQGLLDITADLPQDPDALEVEVLTRYAGIVAQCTPEMVSAFAQVVP